MFFFACHSVFLCVGCMERSGSGSRASTNVKKQTTITAFFKSVAFVCGGVATVPWICSCSVCLYRAERGTDFGKTPTQPRGYKFWGGTNLGGGGLATHAQSSGTPLENRGTSSEEGGGGEKHAAPTNKRPPGAGRQSSIE